MKQSNELPKPDRTSQSNKLPIIEENNQSTDFCCLNEKQETKTVQPVNTNLQPYMNGFESHDSMCCINSVLRSLFSIPPFISFIKKSYEELAEVYSGEFKTKNALIYHLHRVMIQIQEEKLRYLYYEHISDLIFQKSNLLEEGNEDANEFLTEFLRILQENINEIVYTMTVSKNASSIKIAREIARIFDKLFCATIFEHYRCNKCNDIYFYQENVFVFDIFLSDETENNIEISRIKTIKCHLEENFLNKIFRGDTIMKDCATCKRTEEFTIKKISIIPPEILIFHLMRAKFSKTTNEKFKDNRLVIYPTNELAFKLNFERSEKIVKEKNYIFCSVVSHSGADIDTGHYISLIKLIIDPKKNPIFVEFDDGKVTEVEEGDTKTTSINYECYLLFYYLKTDQD